jgi:hypothetical protein
LNTNNFCLGALPLISEAGSDNPSGQHMLRCPNAPFVFWYCSPFRRTYVQICTLSSFCGAETAYVGGIHEFRFVQKLLTLAEHMSSDLYRNCLRWRNTWVQICTETAYVDGTHEFKFVQKLLTLAEHMSSDLYRNCWRWRSTWILIELLFLRLNNILLVMFISFASSIFYKNWRQKQAV